MKILKNKKIRIILLLVIILVGIIILKLSPKKTSETEIPEIIPTITPVEIIPTISEQKGDPGFYESIQRRTKESYPLFGAIPFRTEKYVIDYLKPLTLEIFLKQDTPEIRQEVLNWISSKRVDPASHTIIWKTE